MFTGLAGVYAAKLNETEEKPAYTEGFQVGEGMAISIAPQYVEGSVYGDNRRVKYKRKFKNANLTLGTTRLPAVAQKVFWSREAGADEAIKSNVNDRENYVGIGCYATEEDDTDTPKFTAVWLYKCKVADPGDDFETEGENIAFKTPSLTGIVDPLKNGDWREKQQFDTEADAVAWIKEKAGITSDT